MLDLLTRKVVEQLPIRAACPLPFNLTPRLVQYASAGCAQKENLSAELHVYLHGGHGFGMRDKNTNAAGKWPARFEDWLADLGFLQKP